MDDYSNNIIRLLAYAFIPNRTFNIYRDLPLPNAYSVNGNRNDIVTLTARLKIREMLIGDCFFSIDGMYGVLANSLNDVDNEMRLNKL